MNAVHSYKKLLRFQSVLRPSILDQHGGHRYHAGTHRGGLADVRADGVSLLMVAGRWLIRRVLGK